MDCVGYDQFAFKAKTPAEINSPRRIGDKTVGALFDKKAVSPLGLQNATESIGGLEERHAASGSELGKPNCGCQAANAPTKYRDMRSVIAFVSPWRGVHATMLADQRS
jgi:hypothetical protein